MSAAEKNALRRVLVKSEPGFHDGMEDVKIGPILKWLDR
jgi:hypothetical protein